MTVTAAPSTVTSVFSCRQYSSGGIHPASGCQRQLALAAQSINCVHFAAKSEEENVWQLPKGGRDAAAADAQNLDSYWYRENLELIASQRAQNILKGPES